MGWTGTQDCLAQLELTFPSLESAVSYARRNGIPYQLQGAAQVAAKVEQFADAKCADAAGGQGAAQAWRFERREIILGNRARDLDSRMTA